MILARAACTVDWLTVRGGQFMSCLVAFGLIAASPVCASDIVVQTAEQVSWRGGASAMAVAADEVTVAMGDAGGVLSFWDLSRRQRLGELMVAADEINGVRSLQWVGGSGSVLVTSDQAFTLWNRLASRPVFRQPRALQFGDAGLVDMAASRNSSWLALSSWSEAALIKVGSSSPPEMLALPQAVGAKLALDDAGRQIAAFGYDGLRVFDVPDLSLRWHVPGQAPFEPGQMSFSGDGRWLLVRSGLFSATPAQIYAVDSGHRTELPSGIRQWQFLNDGRLLGLDDAGCWHTWSASQGLLRSDVACRHDAQSTFVILKNDTVLAARRLFDLTTSTVIGELPVNPRQFQIAAIDEPRGYITIAVSPALTDPYLMAWRDRPAPRRYLGPGLYRWDLSTGQQHALPSEDWFKWIGQQSPPWCDAIHNPSVRYRWVSETGAVWIGLDDRIVRCEAGRQETIIDGLTAAPTWLRARSTTLPSGDAVSGPPSVLLMTDTEGALSIFSLPGGELVGRQAATAPELPTHSIGLSPFLDVFMTGPDSPWFVMQDGVVSPSGQKIVEAGIESYDLFGDHLALGSTKGITILDLASGQIHQNIETGARAPVAIRQADKRIYALMPDGALRIFDRLAGDWIVSAYRIGEQGSALIGPDGQYAASRDAVGALTRIDAGGLQEFSGFDVSRNRPDLVLSRLGYATDTYLKSLADLHEQRVRRLGSRHVVDDPGLRLGWHAVPDLQTDIAKQTLLVDVPRDGRLHVAISGVPATARQGLHVAAGVVDIPVVLVPGDNRITVSFEDEAGTRSSILSAFMHLRDRSGDIQNPRTQGSVTYLLGVGVSTYAQSQYNLHYAAKDIQDVAKFFSATLGQDVRTHLLLNAQATQDNILAAGQFLAQARPEDRVILYFAGHGILSPTGHYFFAPTDMDFANPAGRGMSFAQIESLLDATPARERLIFLDSCHAGQNDEGLRGLEETPQTVSVPGAPDQQVTTRGLRRVSKIPEGAADLRRPLLEDVFVDLQMGSGAHVIAAAGAAEFALESDRWSNGVFTAAVLEGLGSRSADLDLDRRIHVDELRRYVSNRVAQLTQGRQLPTARAVNQDLPVVLAQARDPQPWLINGSDIKVLEPSDSTLALDPEATVVVLADPGRVVRVDLTSGQRVALPWTIASVADIVVAPGGSHAVAQVEANSRYASERLLYWIDFERASVVPLMDHGVPRGLFRQGQAGAFTADGTWFVYEADFPDRGLIAIPQGAPSQWQRHDVRMQGMVVAMAGLTGQKVRLVDDQGEVQDMVAATGQVTDRWMLSSLNGDHVRFDNLATRTGLGPDGRYLAGTYHPGGDGSEVPTVLGLWDLQARRWLRDRSLGADKALAAASSSPMQDLEAYLRPALLSLQVASEPRLAVLDGASIRIVDMLTGVEVDWAYRGQILPTMPWVLSPDGKRILGFNNQGDLVGWPMGRSGAVRATGE